MINNRIVPVVQVSSSESPAWQNTDGGPTPDVLFALTFADSVRRAGAPSNRSLLRIQLRRVLNLTVCRNTPQRPEQTQACSRP